VKYLFVHQNFPGQYLHIIRHLLTDAANDVVFLTEPNNNNMAGVRKVVYEMGRKSRTDIHANVRDYELAVHRGERVAEAARKIKQLGYTPDVIIGHHGWGEMLDLHDVFPTTPMLGYYEFYYNTEGYDVNFDPEFPMNANYRSGIRSLNVINHQAFALGQHGQTPTRFQHGAYPAWFRPQIKLLPECTRLEICKPDPTAAQRPFSIGDFTVAPGEKLISFVSRNLEPYRGFHTMMRALPTILGERKDTKVILVGGDDVSYGPKLQGTNWRSILTKELAGRYDASRVLMPGQLSYETYVSLLQRSDTHVYLTYPFVASWSLREAMASGCAIIGADVEPVQEFITHGKTGLLTPCLDPARLAETALHLLDSPTLAKRLRKAARTHAEKHLDMATHIAAYQARIAEILG
jgi:glycosyltransferase involved in cell wall biosynthesis